MGTTQKVRPPHPLRAVQTLHLYGATAVTALGWSVARLLEFDPMPCLPLWFAGMIAVYNVDRLSTDPADPRNVPLRSASTTALARWSLALTGLAVVFLVACPIALGDFPLLALVLIGGLVAFSYSIPFAGRRLKDIPLLKTTAPPAAVIAAYLVPPMVSGFIKPAPLVLTAAAWLASLLGANMILCDVRDLSGDRAAGVRSLPVLAGRKASLWLAASLGPVSAGFALAAAHLSPAHRADWLILAVVTAPAITALTIAAAKPRSEAFYEWWVEGLFFLPPALLLLAHA